MNKKLYRVKFNAKLGTYIAVSELAKSYQGDTTSTSSVIPNSKRITTSLWSQAYEQSERSLKKLALAISIFMAINPVYANVVANKSAPIAQQPTVLKAGTAANIWINTPSASGVSRNSYTQFDVNKNGVILNNSAAAATSKITGSSLAANPQLAKGQAKTIVNEVVSTNPSILQGNLEVLGGKANVIIANPSGITLNGGGFLNANTVTLSTGAISYNTDGSLKQHTIKQGVITVNPDDNKYGLGGNANNPTALELLGRSIDINAPVNASSSINIIAGRNTINLSDSKVTNITGTGTVPTVAIDIAQVGGLYANSIYLHANESGIGVNNAGVIKAKNNIILESNGKITNQSTGTIQNTDVTNGVLALQTNATNAHGDILNQGNIISANSLFVDAGRNINLEKASQTSITNKSSQGILSVEAAGNITIKDTALLKQHADNQDMYVSAGQNIISTTLKTGIVSEIGSNGGVYLDAGNNLNITNTKVTSRTDLALSAAKGMTLKDGLVYSADNSIYLQTTGSDASTSTLALNNFTVDAKKNVVIDSSGDLTINNLDLILAADATQSRIQDLTLNAQRNLTLNQTNKKIEDIQGNLKVQAIEKAYLATGFSTTADTELKSGKSITIQAKNIETKNIGFNGNAVELIADNAITLQNGTKFSTKSGDINLSALKGAITSTNTDLNAAGKVNINANGNVQLTSQKTEQQVSGTTLKNITYTRAKIVGKKGINITSLNNQVNIDPITLTSSAGDISLASKSNLNLVAKANEVVSKNTDGSFKSTKTYIGSNITGKNININSGAALKEDKANITANTGNLISQSQGHHDLINSTLTADKNIQLHSGKGSHLTLRGVTATAKNGHMTLSSNGQLYINSYTQEKKDSNGAVLKDANGKTIYETNWTPKSVVNLKAAGIISLKTTNAMHQLQNFNIEGGAVNIESGTGMGWRGKNTINAINSKLLADDKNLSQLNGDVSILANKHNLLISPEIIDIKAYGDIDLRAKDGMLHLEALSENNGIDSGKNINLITNTGEVYLEGKSILLEAPKISAKKDINIVSNSGDLQITAIKNDFNNSNYDKNKINWSEILGNNYSDFEFFLQKNPNYKAELNNLLHKKGMAEYYLAIPGAGSKRVDAFINDIHDAEKGIIELNNKYNASNLYNRAKILSHEVSSLLQKNRIYLEGQVVKNDNYENYLISGYYHKLANLSSSGGNVKISSGKGIFLASPNIYAENNIEIFAKGILDRSITSINKENQLDASILIANIRDQYELGTANDKYYQFASINKPSKLNAKNISIISDENLKNGNILIQGANIEAVNKNNILASGNIDLMHSVDTIYTKSIETSSKKEWLGLKKSNETKTNILEAIIGKGINLKGSDILVESLQGNVNLYGSVIHAPKNMVDIKAAKEINMYAFLDKIDDTETIKKDSSFLGAEYRDKKSVYSKVITTQIPTTLTGKYIKTTSGNNTRLQGTRFSFSDGVLIKAGNSDLSSEGKIILENVSSTFYTNIEKSKNSVAWQEMASKGENVTFSSLPKFEGPVAPKFEAKGGLTVQVPVVAGKNNDVHAEVIKLSNQPGYDYLKQLVNRKDIDWQAVQLAQESWNYKQQGLTGAGAALIAIIVTVASAGTAAGAGAAIANASTAALGATGSAMAGAATTAAVTSLATQASVSLINNGGDIAKTLKDLGSKDSVKGLATSIVTASLLAGVGQQIGVKPESTAFNDRLINNFTNAVGSTLVHTAINGGSLKDNLEKALLAGLTSALQGELASYIGKNLDKVDPSVLEYTAHKIAHAIAGCVAGAIQKDCEAGAIGAGVGEIVTSFFDKPADSTSQTEKDAFTKKVIGTTKIVSGVVAAYAGYDVNTAAMSAENAVTNNYLTSAEWKQLNQKVSQACIKDARKCNVNEKQEIASLVDASRKNNNTLDLACAVPTSTTCMTKLREVYEGEKTRLDLGIHSSTIANRTELNNYSIIANGTMSVQRQYEQLKAGVNLQTWVTKNCSTITPQACGALYQQQKQKDAALLLGMWEATPLVGNFVSIVNGAKVLFTGQNLVGQDADKLAAILDVVSLGIGSKVAITKGAAGNLTATYNKTSCSFRGDMEVKTLNGYRPIQSITQNDWVYSLDEISGQGSYQQVLAHYSNSYKETVYITTKNNKGDEQTIVSNKIHPFFTVPNSEVPVSSEGHFYKGNISNGQWVDASNLKSGDKLLDSQNQWQEIVSITIKPEPLQAYNLTVDTNHTYFIKGFNVDLDGVWVHNDCLGGVFAKTLTPDELRELNKTFGGAVELKSVETVFANAARYTNANDKMASLIRDIAGSHLFDNGNKRTTVAALELIIKKSGIDAPPTAVLWKVVKRTADGELRSIEQISKALRGGN